MDYEDKELGQASANKSSDVDRGTLRPNKKQPPRRVERFLLLNNSCGPCQKGNKNVVLKAKWYCQECKEYFCPRHKSDHDKLKMVHIHKCKHQMDKLTNPCDQCGRQNKLAKADWYCNECEEYLCNQCQASHLDFKINENHRLVSILDKNSDGKREENASQDTPAKEESGRKTSPLLQFLPTSVKVFFVFTVMIIVFITIFGPLLQRKPLSERIAKLSRRINVRVSDDYDEPSIISSAFLPDGRLLLVDSNNYKLKLFDSNFDFVKQKEFGVMPLRIAVYDENEVVLTLGSKEIVLLSVNKDIAVKKTMPVGFDCLGVDYIRKDRIAITDWHSVMYIMETDGEIVSKISTDTAGHDLFDNPWYVTMDRTRSRSYVANSKSHDVCALNLAGNNDVIFRYKHKELIDPYGMAVDQDGNLYICGKGSHNIHMVSPDGKYIKTLLSDKDGINYPWTISFTSDGNTFIIGNGYSGGVQVFTMGH